MLFALASFGLFSALFGFVANVCGFLILVPVRLFARLVEKAIETPRDGSWKVSRRDAFLLDLATRTAIDQVSRFGAYPTAASSAVGFTRMVGFA